MKKKYPITTQKQIRKLFWQYHPDYDKTIVPDYSGDGKMYRTDTRCAFSDFLRNLEGQNQISPELAERATL